MARQKKEMEESDNSKGYGLGTLPIIYSKLHHLLEDIPIRLAKRLTDRHFEILHDKVSFHHEYKENPFLAFLNHIIICIVKALMINKFLHTKPFHPDNHYVLIFYFFEIIFTWLSFFYYSVFIFGFEIDI